MPFDQEHAGAVTENLHALWADYLAQQEMTDDEPTFLDFVAWVFYTQGWKEALAQVAEGHHSDSPTWLGRRDRRVADVNQRLRELRADEGHTEGPITWMGR